MTDKESLPSIFDYLNSVSNKKYMKPDSDLKVYNQYIMNKGLSYYPDAILLVDEVNKGNISDQWHYEFLYHVLDKKVRRSKWFKPDQDDDLKVIVEYFDINMSKAREIIKLFSKDEIENIKQTLNKGG